MLYSSSFQNLNDSELPEDIPCSSRGGRQERPSLCLVCGNKAHCYHYGVPACNGCKTYFRRICVSEKDLVCKANGDCFDLTKRTKPSKCRSCRYNKCIKVGMDPSALVLDEKESTAANFVKLSKRVVLKEEEGEEPEDDDCQVVAVVAAKRSAIKTLQSIENRIQQTVDMLTYLESRVEQFRRSAYNPDWNMVNGLEYLLNTGSQIFQADKLGPMKLDSKPGLINIPASKAPPSYSPDKKHWLYCNLMTTVEYGKTFMFFHRLDSQDKLILTKHVTLACTNLHVSFSSVANKFDFPTQPDGAQSPFQDENHYSNVVMSVVPLIRCQVTYTEYILLKAICFCNPAVPDLSRQAQEVLLIEREKYADALFDHCLRNRRNGPSHFADLISIIDVLERQQRMQKDLHLLHVAPMVAKAPMGFRIRIIEDVMNC